MGPSPAPVLRTAKSFTLGGRESKSLLASAWQGNAPHLSQQGRLQPAQDGSAAAAAPQHRWDGVGRLRRKPGTWDGAGEGAPHLREHLSQSWEDKCGEQQEGRQTDRPASSSCRSWAGGGSGGVGAASSWGGGRLEGTGPYLFRVVPREDAIAVELLQDILELLGGVWGDKGIALTMVSASLPCR